MGGGHSRREDSFCRGRVVSGQGVFREQGLSWEGLMRGRTGALPPLPPLYLPGINDRNLGCRRRA